MTPRLWHLLIIVAVAYSVGACFPSLFRKIPYVGQYSS